MQGIIFSKAKCQFWHSWSYNFNWAPEALAGRLSGSAQEFSQTFPLKSNLLRWTGNPPATSSWQERFPWHGPVVFLALCIFGFVGITVAGVTAESIKFLQIGVYTRLVPLGANPCSQQRVLDVILASQCCLPASTYSDDTANFSFSHFQTF